MGKSAAGAVWLNKNLLSEYDYWQFWRNTADGDVIRFLKLFTDISIHRIQEIESSWAGSDLNKAKILLADEATTMLHGAECLAVIHNTVQSLFPSANGSRKGGKKGEGEGEGEAVEEETDALDSLPKIHLSSSECGNLPTVVDLLLRAGMTNSKGEARRLIKSMGVRINNNKISDEGALISKNDFDSKCRLKLSSGKKNHCLIIFNKN